MNPYILILIIVSGLAWSVKVQLQGKKVRRQATMK